MSRNTLSPGVSRLYPKRRRSVQPFFPHPAHLTHDVKAPHRDVDNLRQVKMLVRQTRRRDYDPTLY